MNEIDELEKQLQALFRGSEAHDIVPLLCTILRDHDRSINLLLVETDNEGLY